ncbi:hypothetical protein BD779DRAFT_1550593 [Infundibulicybe gibba]|nr:hypothetical protein BD779DRAFT_1550593 [Infundibulicybe gibba]
MHAKRCRKTRIRRKSQQIKRTNQILLKNKNIQYSINAPDLRKANQKRPKAIIQVLMEILRITGAVGQKSDQ